jgi:hypothetical protein
MDNHADNDNVFNDNYVAGITDGICEISLNKFYPKGKLVIKPQIKFVLNNKNILNGLDRWLSINNINHFIQNNNTTVVFERFTLIISRYSKCIEFSNKVSKLCVLKRRQLEIIKDFCEHRIQNVNDNGWKFSNTPFDNYELACYNTFVNYNIYDNIDYNYRNFMLPWLLGFIKTRNINSNNLITTDSFLVKENIIGICKTHGYSYHTDVYSGKEKRKFGDKVRRNRFNIYLDEQFLNTLFKIPETNTQDIER